MIDENGVDIQKLTRKGFETYCAWLRAQHNPLGVTVLMPTLECKPPRKKPRPPQAMVFIVLCRICGGEVYRTEPIRYRGRKKLQERLIEEKRLAFVKHRINAGHRFKYVAKEGREVNAIDIQLQEIWVDAESGDDELEIQGTDPAEVALRRVMRFPGPLQVMRELGGWEA